MGFTARTVELFQMRGIEQYLGPIERSPVGHFGGVPLDFSRVPGAEFGGKMVPQAQTEAALAKWVDSLGVTVRRGAEVVGLEEDEGSVTVRVRSAGGDEGTVTSAYLVGCDGGRSIVRKLAGFGFPGTEPTMEMFLADVHGIDVEDRLIGQSVDRGMVMVGKMPDGATRLIVCDRDNPPKKRTEPVDFTEIAETWQRLTGSSIADAHATWTSSFTDQSRQSDTYRRGRVLLAGDSAHVHLPAGGQGMNASIQDAMNLGWKLAAHVHGTGPDGLLDTYDTERHAVGERLLLNTRAQGLLFLSGKEMQPMRDILAELLIDDPAAHRLIGMVSGLDITYPVANGNHALLGRRMPDLVVEGPEGIVSTYELLRSGRFLLLDLAGPSCRWYSDDARLVFAAGTVHGDSAAGWPEGTNAVLVRPDGYVVWTEPGCGDLEEAVRTWVGTVHLSETL